MLLEKVIFNLLAFSLFIIIFFKIIRRNDTNYIFLLILQALGITISFFEISIGIDANLLFKTIRYMLSIFLPLAIIIIEFSGINFSEIISVVLANILFALGDTKTAKAILVKLITKYPNSYLGHQNLGKIYEYEGGMRRAIDEYVAAVDIKKNDYDSYYKIANLLKELGKKDEAIEMLENLVKNKPDYYEGSCLLGDLLCEQERFKEAANVYQSALKYRPDDFELYYNLGIVYTRLSDFQMAKEMYEKAAEINHRLYGANYNLGQIALIQKDLDTATQYFEKSLYGDLEAMSYYQLAKICALKGEKDKAINFINKAIELEPKLLKIASKERAFKDIREHITVSVKLKEKEKEEVVKVQEEYEEEQEEIKEDKKSHILKRDERVAQIFLEETNSLIDEISENTEREENLEKHVSNIIDMERLRRLEEIDNREELDKENEKVDSED
ncbi:MAG: tetratricopeptide repeat protein [Clostridia bacterium]|nr:tetratricopeptide repeat protein [Clostridia bacterium]